MVCRTRSVLAIIALAVFIPFLATPQAYAQAPGYADIIYPQDGEILFGLITVQGSAFHPSFVKYDLSFSYPDDPTATWFEIGPPVGSPVREGDLGIWDTAGLSEGEYRLRLRVHLENGTIIETYRENLIVSASAPISTPTTAIETPGGEHTVHPTATPTPTPRPTPIPMQDADEWTDNLRTLRTGFILGVIALTGTGIYLITRRQLQSYWGNLRMRDLHRDTSRRRRRR